MIVDAVANNGPVSICYDVVGDFQFYKKGVYKRYACLESLYVACASCFALLFIVQNARMEVRMSTMLVKKTSSNK